MAPELGLIRGLGLRSPAALVHLLTPLDAQVGVEAKILTDAVLYRGERSRDLTAEGVRELISAVQVPTDSFLRPVTDRRGRIAPLSAVKVGPAGAGTLVWGAREVLGLPNGYIRPGLEIPEGLKILDSVWREGVQTDQWKEGAVTVTYRNGSVILS